MRKMMHNSNALEEKVESLVDVLYDHLEAHRELAELLKEKEKAVVALDFTTMDEVVEKERAVIERISAQETERVEMTVSISEMIGGEEASVRRLSAIVPYVPQEIGYELVEVRDKLRDTAYEIEKYQARNRTLITQSMDHIHLFLTTLSGVDPEARNYSAHGSIDQETHPAVLDRRL